MCEKISKIFTFIAALAEQPVKIVERYDFQKLAEILPKEGTA